MACDLAVASRAKQVNEILARLDDASTWVRPQMADGGLQSLSDAIASMLGAGQCRIVLSDNAGQKDPSYTSTGVLRMPISAGGRCYGSIQVDAAGGAHSFDVADVELLRMLAWSMARAIESVRLHSVLRSRYAQLSLTSRGNLRQFVAAAVQHPDKTARLLARTFYRDLARAGFGCSQIIGAATEIISQLGKHLQQRKDDAAAHGATDAKAA